jgi:hypothetical protein
MEEAVQQIPYDFLTKYLGGDALTLPCSVATHNGILSAKGLGDTGASGYLFMSVRFGRLCTKFLKPRRITGFKPRIVRGYDGKSSQLIDVILEMDFVINERTVKNAKFIVLDMTHDVIIGRKWYERHDVGIDVKGRRLEFPENWKPDGEVVTVKKPLKATEDVSEEASAPKFRSTKYRKPTVEDAEDEDHVRSRKAKKNRKAKDRRKDRKAREQAVLEKLEQLKRLKKAQRKDKIKKEAERPKRVSKETAPKEVKVRFSNNVKSSTTAGRDTPEVRKMDRALNNHERFSSPRESRAEKERRRSTIHRDREGAYIYATKEDEKGLEHLVKHRLPDVAAVKDDIFDKLAKGREDDAVISTVGEIDRELQKRRVKAGEDICNFMPHDTEELRQMARDTVPRRYRELLDAFSKAESDRLPRRTKHDHKIRLKKGCKPEDLGYSPLYKFSMEELEAARLYIQENLEKGFIVPSSNPWAAPVLMIPKPGGGLRFCVDYRKLNAMSEKDRYPLPLIDETMAQITKAKIFTKLDVRQAFHRTRMDEGSEDLTAFRTRYGAYKYKVMPFGLSNGPAAWQRRINELLMPYLDIFCHAYVDDILIWSESKEEHEEHVRTVLTKLMSAGLQVDLKKCEFHVTKTKYLGYIISTEGIAADPEKVQTIVDWEPPQSVKAVQAFLGFCGFYRRFVEGYSRVAKPLTNLTRKGEVFKWTDECHAAFEELKRRLQTAPVMRHYQPDSETRMETDASDCVCAGVLSQKAEDGEWHPVAFYSKAMNTAQMNYAIHDKEMLAVMLGLEAWKPELIGLQRPEPFLVVTDHRALEHFSTKRQLNSRQAHWADILAQYNFTITYRPGTQNTIPDVLSRKAEMIRDQKTRQAAARSLVMFQPVRGQCVYQSAEEEETQVYMIAPNQWEDQDITYISAIHELETVENDGHPAGFVLVDKLLEANRSHPSMEQFWQKATRQDEPHFTSVGGRNVLYKRRLIVPDFENLRTWIVDDVHSRTITAHPGRNKTRKLVAERYWWPGMSGFIDQFVSNCECRSAKTPRDKTPGLLQPLPIPLRGWQHVIVDFKDMTKDKESGKDNLMVIIDRLTKESCSLPCKKSITGRQAAKLYYRYAFRWVGLPEIVGSDQGPQFKSDFTDELSKILGIRWKLSSAGHSQSAGNAEIMNQVHDQRLRPLINNYQDNWDSKMPALDWVQKIMPNESLDWLSPHEVKYGYPARMHFDWDKATKDWKALTSKSRIDRKDAQLMAQTLQGFIEAGRQGLLKAEERMRKQANKKRREPDFGPGDWVLIVKQGQKITSRPSDKLDYPMTRNAYQIKEMAGSSYLLEVPEGWRGSKVFHADRLRKHPHNPVPGQDYTRPAAEDVDGEEEWIVDEILASREHNGKLQYQVKWSNWDPTEEWFPAKDFKNAAALLEKFHADYPEKAGPPARLENWLRAAAEDRFDKKHPDDNKPAKLKGMKLRRSNRKK